jgi:hypothetical protein
VAAHRTAARAGSTARAVGRAAAAGTGQEAAAPREDTARQVAEAGTGPAAGSVQERQRLPFARAPAAPDTPAVAAIAVAQVVGVAPVARAALVVLVATGPAAGCLVVRPILLLAWRAMRQSLQRLNRIAGRHGPQSMIDVIPVLEQDFHSFARAAVHYDDGSLEAVLAWCLRPRLAFSAPERCRRRRSRCR